MANDEKINALLVLESANQLPPEHAEALKTLRAAGLVPKSQVPFEASAGTTSRPGALDKGGFVDTKLLSGQLPQAATMAASLLAGKTLGPAIGPAVVGGAGAVSGILERLGRYATGLENPQIKTGSIGEGFKLAGEDFAKNAAFEAGGGIVGKVLPIAAKAVSSGAASIAKPVVKFAKDVSTTNVPILSGINKFVTDIAKERADKVVTQSASKFGFMDPLQTGRKVTDAGSKIIKAASDQYHDLKGGLLKKFGAEPVSPNILRQSMDDEIKGITELAGDLDPNDAALKKVLEKWQTRFSPSQGNPTLREMDDIATTLYNASKKPNANPAFARMYKAARENLLEAMDNAVVAKGEGTRAYTGAVGQKDVLLDEAGQFSEKIAKGEKSLENVQFPKGWAQRRGVEKSTAALGETRGKLSEVEQMIADMDSTNAEVAAAARKQYAEARKTIAKNLSVKEGPMGKLIKHGKEFPSEVVERSRSLGRLDLPEVLDEAISVNPEYKAVAKDAILGDIFSRGTDKKTLAKSVGQYKNVLSRVLEAGELEELYKLAGIATEKSSAVLPPWLKEAMPEATKQLTRAAALEVDRENQ